MSDTQSLVPFRLLDQGNAREVRAAVSGSEVGLDPESLRAEFGYELKPEGLCHGALCIPVRDRQALVRDGRIRLAALATLLDRPLAVDADEQVAALGVSAGSRAQRMESLEAPDFTLPDLSGTPHSLSELRGRKVFLLAYASW